MQASGLRSHNLGRVFEITRAKRCQDARPREGLTVGRRVPTAASKRTDVEIAKCRRGDATASLRRSFREPSSLSKTRLKPECAFLEIAERYGSFACWNFPRLPPP